MEFKKDDIVVCIDGNRDCNDGTTYQVQGYCGGSMVTIDNGMACLRKRFRHATPKEIFDYKYVGDKIAVHCPTEELANEFLGLGEKFGYKWRGGRSYKDYNNWKAYKNDTHYNISRGEYCNKEYWLNEKCKIVEFKSEKKCDWMGSAKEEISKFMNEQFERASMFGSSSYTVEDIRQHLELPSLGEAPYITHLKEIDFKGPRSAYSDSLGLSGRNKSCNWKIDFDLDGPLFKTKPQIEFVKHDKLKRTTVVSFKDGKTITSKVRKGEKYNEYIGIMTCLVKYLTGFNARDLREYMDYAQDLDVVEIKKRTQANKDESKQRKINLEKVMKDAKKLGFRVVK